MTSDGEDKTCVAALGRRWAVSVGWEHGWIHDPYKPGLMAASAQSLRLVVGPMPWLSFDIILAQAEDCKARRFIN
jgi:hypothetical protein